MLVYDWGGGAALTNQVGYILLTARLPWIKNDVIMVEFGVMHNLKASVLRHYCIIRVCTF